MTDEEVDRDCIERCLRFLYAASGLLNFEGGFHVCCLKWLVSINRYEAANVDTSVQP